MNSISIQIPVLLLASFFTKTSVGLYFHAFKIMSVPVTIIGRSVGQVFFQKTSEKIDKPEELKYATQEVFKKMFLMCVVPMAMITVFGDYIFDFVFGDEWRKAGVFAQIISPWLLVNFVTAPLTLLFELLKKQNIFIIFNGLFFVFRLSSLLIGYFIFNDVFYAIALYSVTSFLIYSGMLIYLFRLTAVNLFKMFIFVSKYCILIFAVLFIIRKIII